MRTVYNLFVIYVYLINSSSRAWGYVSNLRQARKRRGGSRHGVGEPQHVGSARQGDAVESLWMMAARRN